MATLQTGFFRVTVNQFLLRSGAALVLLCTAIKTHAADENSSEDTTPPAAAQHVIVVTGAAGTQEYGALFSEWAQLWQQAAEAADADCTTIGQTDASDDLQQLQTALQNESSVETDEPLWLVLIGHGTFDGRDAMFNLRGRDLSADQTADFLKDARRPVAVINCASCSAPFINALSGPGRIVVTATKDGAETQFTRFGGYMAAAVGTLEADLNRDGQTSLLEAWLRAAAETKQYYQSDGRLETEHSLLDDNGDKKGTRADAFDGIRPKENLEHPEQLDGKLAARWHLVRSAAERQLTPEQRKTRDALEEKLENLRSRRKEFSEKDYLRQLEEILLPLARLYQAVEQHASKPASSSKETP